VLHRVARDACRDPELGGPIARRTNLVKRAERAFKENRFRMKDSARGIFLLDDKKFQPIIKRRTLRQHTRDPGDGHIRRTLI